MNFIRNHIIIGLFGLLSFLFSASSFAQSLKQTCNQIISNTQFSEEQKLDSLLILSDVQVRINTDSGRFVAFQLLKEAEKNNNSDFIGSAYHNIGVSYAWQGKYEEAMKYYNMSLEALQKKNDPARIALIHTSIGGVYFDQNKYIENLEHWLVAKSFAEKGDNIKRVEMCNNNLGALYLKIGKNEEAKNLFLENLELNRKNNWETSEAFALVNLSGIYLEENKLDTAELYARRAYEIHSKAGMERQAASTLQDLAELEFLKGNVDKGIEYALESMETMKRLKDDYNYNNVKVFLGEKYLDLKDFQLAKTYCLETYQASKIMESLGLQRSSCGCLSKAYYGLQDFKRAYEFEMEYQSLKDSILNDDVSLDLAKREFEVGYKLKAEKDSMEQARKDEISEIEHQNEIRRQRNFTYFGLFLALIATGMSLYVFRNFQKKKKANKEILMSKQIIEVKNKEITDSINYAKRIQTAMLPSLSQCDQVLQEHFIIYKPKDIVAGDFYWVQEKHGRRYFAVADCTGHGVPGAMMSVVCNNALNRALREFDLLAPGKILDQTREIVISELNKGESEQELARSIKDGMDIALGCVYEMNGTKILEYSGAYNSIYILRQGEHAQIEGEVNIQNYDEQLLIELKADKQPVGIGHSKNNFTTKKIVLEPNDLIYVFSDGYADQFGNAENFGDGKFKSIKPQGKKFKTSNLKKLLVQIAEKPLMQQKMLLNSNFEDWKGDIEQLDDVCVMGIKVS
ncbi:MAG: SpoIIE family protein phosphatase [Crocinitomicaceae bacterium]